MDLEGLGADAMDHVADLKLGLPENVRRALADQQARQLQDILARHILNLELERARTEQRTLPDDVKVGVMLEVPSLLWQLDELLKSVVPEVET